MFELSTVLIELYIHLHLFKLEVCLHVLIISLLEDLSPDSNMDKALADMIVDGVMDIRAKRTKYQFESDPATKVSSWSNKSRCCLIMSRGIPILFNLQGKLKLVGKIG